MPDTSILTAAELDSIRRPYRGARLLPRRAYHEPAILDWEREHILGRDWVIVGASTRPRRPARISRPSSTASPSWSSAARTTGFARSTTSAVIAARPSWNRNAGRPSA